MMDKEGKENALNVDSCHDKKSQKTNIKIFVSHRIDKDTAAFKNDLLIPVRCGAMFDTRPNVEILGDNTGENISERRMSFCELTVQYWAWKNVNADYYGLFHYRRFLNFSKFCYPTDEYGNILAESINEETKGQFSLEEDSMRSLIERYDLIIPMANDVSKFPEQYKSIYDHWNRAEHLHIEDLKIMVDVIARLQPDYYETAKEYLSGTEAYFTSISIMKQQLFFEYCQWLYPILFELEREIDISYYTEEGQRTVAHLAERLLGIYVFYLRKKHHATKIKELQRVFFKNPASSCALEAAFKSESNISIPIVEISRSVFAPVSTVQIQSIIENASCNYNYDIVVIHTDFTRKDKELIKSLSNGKQNISIRFFDASQTVEKYRLRADSSQHVPVETFYRFLIPEILPEYNKVIYLDGDIVCETDIARLYEINIDGYMMAATRDADVNGQMNMPNSDMRSYAIETLKMKNPYDYFQAGVLVLNTKELRKCYSTEQWFSFAHYSYRYQDQDILNMHCYGHVKFLDMSWNVMIDCNNYRVPVVIRHATAKVCQEYHIARENPYIIHFAGFEKPWERPGVDFEAAFWKYARHTPCYERLLFNMLHYSMPNNNPPALPYHSKARRWADKHMPKGTRRREFAKFLLPKGSRRWNFLKKWYYKIFKG